MTHSMPSASDGTNQARGRLFDMAPSVTPPAESHWYVDSTDYPGYCAACSLPKRNARHTARPGVAA